MSDFLLREDGGYLLREDGGKLILRESAETTTSSSTTTSTSTTTVTTSTSSSTSSISSSTSFSTSSTSSSTSLSTSSTSSSTSLSTSSTSSSTSLSTSSTSTSTTTLPTDKTYTQEAKVLLPADNTDLASTFTYQQYLDVATDNDVRVEQCSAGGFTIQQFKKQNTNYVNYINVSWQGQSGRAPSSSKVVLQVWVCDGLEWADVAENNEASANTDFTLTGSIVNNVEYYYDINNWVTFRVYQEGK